MRRLLLATIVSLALLAPEVAHGASTSASMNVSAVVLARAVVNVVQQPAQVVVTADDIKRGYVDIAEPFVVKVRTNSRRGYQLQVANSDPAFRTVEIRSGDLSMNVAGESFTARPYVPGGESIAMTVRFALAEGVHEGSHAFPLAVAAEPLN